MGLLDWIGVAIGGTLVYALGSYIVQSGGIAGMIDNLLGGEEGGIVGEAISNNVFETHEDRVEAIEDTTEVDTDSFWYKIFVAPWYNLTNGMFYAM